jgi:hypothetical protein
MSAYSGTMKQRVAVANASNALEGITPSALVQEIQADLIAGKITTEEALQKVIAAHAPDAASSAASKVSVVS